MKLTLDEIWKMADLLEESQKIKVSGKKIVQERGKTQERVLRLPQLQISENWGKENTVEREELENIVYSATRGANDPFSRLRMIQEQMTNIAAGKDVESPQKVLSQVILLETLNRLFKSFQPSPAGFINEAFLSVIYGTYQKDAMKANAEGDIGDITDGNVPVSLKTLTSRSAHVKGSVANLVNSINNTEEHKVYFDLYLKDSSGADSPVGQLRVVRFVVDGSNINQFLQLPEGSKITTDAQGNLEIPQKTINEGYVLSEEEPIVPGQDEGLSPEAQQIFDKAIVNTKGKPKKLNPTEQGRLAFIVLKANNFDLPKVGNFRQFVNELDANALAVLSSELQKEPKTPNIKKLDKMLARSEIVKTKASKKGLRTEFIIPETHWSKFARDYAQDEIVLEFSDNRLEAIIQSAVKSLDASITEIFNNLADFTATLQNYLTSTKGNRSLQGQKAVELAKKLKPSTEKVVKDEK